MNIGDKTWDPFRRQAMMILNVTPDSFYAGSRFADEGEMRRHVESGLEQGASIVDVGGYSSRPGAGDVPPQEEFRRVAGAMDVLCRYFPDTPVSVDTFRSGIVRRVVEEFGPVVVNDISAGRFDGNMIPLVAQLGVPYVAMHSRGTPQTMEEMDGYEAGVTDEVVSYLENKIAALREAGVEQVIVDPGFGFAKSLEQNYELLRSLDRFVFPGVPLLVGLSRKSMVYRVTGRGPGDVLAGTAALHWECLRKGASIIRAHDVGEAMDVIRLFNCYAG